MLVLSRKQGESIVITIDNQLVEVRILSTDRGKARIGVVAPDNVAVHREEVWRRRAEFTNQAASVLAARP